MVLVSSGRRTGVLTPSFMADLPVVRTTKSSP